MLDVFSTCSDLPTDSRGSLICSVLHFVIGGPPVEIFVLSSHLAAAPQTNKSRRYRLVKIMFQMIINQMGRILMRVVVVELTKMS